MSRIISWSGIAGGGNGAMESRSDGESAARDEPPSNMAAGSGASEFIACQFYACWSGNGRNHLGGANSTSRVVARKSLIRRHRFSVHLLQLASAQAGGW